MRLYLDVEIILTHDSRYVNIVFSYFSNYYRIFVKLLYYLFIVYAFSEQYVQYVLLQQLRQPVVTLS